MSSSKYKRAIQIFAQTNLKHKKVFRSNQKFDQLMKYFGYPYNNCKNIHVTGTNGKGSVCMKTAQILNNSGYKVGLYTSPSILTFRQRIKVNGQNISKQDFADLFMQIFEAGNKMNIDVSFFQYLTGVAFLHYRQKKCDFSVIEVGIGGRHDTTNVINPVVSAIVSLGLDHVDMLGNTLDQIAEQKAGIIKQQRPVVLGPTAARPIVLEYAQKMNSKVYTIRQNEQIDNFQITNKLIATQICEILQPNFSISQQAIQKGVLAKQPCRMQQIAKQKLPPWINKKVVLDVGHNAQAIKHAIKYYKKEIKKKDSILNVLFGCSSNKKFKDMLLLLQQEAEQIYLVQAKNPRALPISQLQAIIGEMKYPYKFRIVGQGNISKTMLYACADPKSTHILVTGSFFIMPQTLKFLDPKLSQEDENQIVNQQYILLNKTKQ